MGYFLIAVILLLTSSTALATEDSLRKTSPYDIFEILEDLYSTPEQAEEALDYFDVLSFTSGLDRNAISGLPGITASTALRLGASDTLNWSIVSERLSYRQSQVLTEFVVRPSRYLWSSRSRVQLDPQATKEKGYNDGRTLGTPYKIYDRLLLSQYGFRAGLLQSKDAGEKNTFDHLRGYLQLIEKQSIAGELSLDQAIIGDFALGFGSGLLFSNGGMIGKSNEVIDAVEPNARWIQGYLSSSIATGFRGAAATLSHSGFSTSLFYSDRSYDGRSDSGIITSMPLDGYHRTESEVSKIDVARSGLLGGSVSYQSSGETYTMQLGVTGYNEVFKLPVRTGGFVHNFEGKALSMISQHGSYASELLSASYEVAMSSYDSGSGMAGVVSLSYEPSRQWQFALNGRYFPHDFVSRHGSTFGESTDDAQNERGVYFGVRYSPLEELTLSSYLDLANTFVPPYLAQNNFRTTDILLHADYEITPKMLLTSRSKWKRKSDEERLDDSRILGSRDQFNSRLEHEWWPVDDVRLRTRGEIVTVGYNNFTNAKAETGFLLSGNVKWRLFEMIDPELRVTWFNAPSYDSRLYVYENDLAGASGLTMLYGAGMRYSLLISADIVKGIAVAAKYGITVYSKEREFGSGITERTGKSSSKLGFQLDVQF